MKKRLGLRALSTLFLACTASACSGNGAVEAEATANDAEQAVSATTTGAEDSFVSTSMPEMTRGDRAFLRVGKSSSLERQAYLKFQVTGVPAGATNVRATLKLHASTTSAGAIEVHRAASDTWTESSLVLSNAPGSAAAILSSVAGTSAGAWSSFDVSSAVTSNGTFSFVLKYPSGVLAEFASKEAGAATAPTLEVTYDKAVVATTAFGAAYNPHNDARFDQLSAAWGGMKVVRSYDGSSGVTPFLKTFQDQDVAHGAVSSYSFKYLPSEVLAGKHDAELRSFFQSIKDGHKTYWTYWHEPDDELYKTHTFTPAAYRAAWAYIKKIATSVQATRPNLQIFATLIIMQYSMTPKVAPSRPLEGPDGMYPGDAVIDVFGVDAYNSTADQGQVVDAATQFGKVIDFAQLHKKPWAIGELGSCPVAGNPGGRAKYLSGALSYWKTRQVPVFVAYFNVDWPTCDYRFDNDAAATKVWHDAVTTGYASF